MRIVSLRLRDSSALPNLSLNLGWLFMAERPTDPEEAE